MTITDIVGTVGVTLLLIAYFLNLINTIETGSYAYLLLNVVGAGLACLASVLLHYWPFIILEGCWTLVSLVGIVKKSMPSGSFPPRG